MSRLSRSLSRPRSAAAGIFLLVGSLLPVQIGIVLTRDVTDPPVRAQPFDDTLGPKMTVRALPSSPKPKPKPKPKATKKAVAKPKPSPAKIWSGLGAWVDVYDFEALDPVSAVAKMKSYGTRTLYIQTGRYNTEHDVAPEVGPWLVAAHAAGIEVVGWYLPSYKNMSLEVRRTVAIAKYRYAGHRFDALGIDIEFKGDVRHVPTWNERVGLHAERVRAALGNKYQIAAITPPPLQMDVAPARWAGFPWRELAKHSDVIMLMSYWSFRDCDKVPQHCAYPFTVENVRETRRLIGRDLPIHIIGGVGDSISKREVADFVRGALAVDAFGASMYDMRTTTDAYWTLLSRLRTL